MYDLCNKYLVERFFIQIDVRCFVSKESKSALTYIFMNHLFDTIYNLLRFMIFLGYVLTFYFFWQEYKLSFRVAD